MAAPFVLLSHTSRRPWCPTSSTTKCPTRRVSTDNIHIRSILKIANKDIPTHTIAVIPKPQILQVTLLRLNARTMTSCFGCVLYRRLNVIMAQSAETGKLVTGHCITGHHCPDSHRRICRMYAREGQERLPTGNCVCLGSGFGTSQIPFVLFVTSQRAGAALSGCDSGCRGVALVPRLQLCVCCTGPCCARGGCCTAMSVAGALVAQGAV